MSTAVPAPPGTVAPGATTTVPDEEIRIYGHSNLFYWWPVWVTGFILAFLTYLDGHVMAVVPTDSQVKTGQVLPGSDGQPRDVVVAPAGQSIPPPSGANYGEPQRKLLVSENNNYGVVFVAVVLLVVVVTNFIFRGLISILVVAALAIMTLFVALMGWWDHVLAWLGGLDVRMNAGGYLAFAIPLCLIWAFSTFVYDRYVYVIVSRGQVRIRKEIGGGEIAVDSSGLLLTKERDDLFRHWLLGLGTGDLHVKTGVPSNLDFELNNVILIGTKLARIQELLREKEVTHDTVARA
jgi:hypothetical protein